MTDKTPPQNEEKHSKDEQKVWTKPELEEMELLSVKSGSVAFSEPSFPPTGTLS